MDDFQRRLRQVIDESFDRKVSVFARECAKVDPRRAPSASSLQKYLSGVARPGLDKLQCIAKASARPVAFFAEPSEHEYAIYYPTSELVNLGNYFRAARHRIDILTTELTVLTGVREPRNYLEEIESALNRAAELRVRLLVLSPQSNFVTMRGNQLGYAGRVRVYRHEHTTALDIVRSTAIKYRDRFQVRLFDELPSQISYIIDNRIFFSTIAHGIGSRGSVTFELLATLPGAYQTFIVHFLRIWDSDQNEDALSRYGL